jgi:hypothetical protein
MNPASIGSWISPTRGFSPAAPTNVSVTSRFWFIVAISAAAQPPSPSPTRWDPVGVERVEHEVDVDRQIAG